jgi:hypothetical protein
MPFAGFEIGGAFSFYQKQPDTGNSLHGRSKWDFMMKQLMYWKR